MKLKVFRENLLDTMLGNWKLLQFLLRKELEAYYNRTEGFCIYPINWEIRQ